ncbi:MAG TPA: undecaprenyldiphospho-muramoylpentapeptide beta-N-acetylglucosaminyltransferase [Nitrospiraceae bacterium]|nr:undecaprenyldiphospho-muramoylpentapeptide beta-N-acetylglucosaminyltransferase [Nitrospiraceae bacterium]
MTIVIAAGGTGGHLYPAVALAREFLHRDPMTKVLFVGTSRGLESKVLAHEGFELVLINAKPVMGKGLTDVLKGLCAMPLSLWQCGRILSQRQARLVIGVGGYTSPMMVLAAALKRIPRVILEPNAYPGLANKAVAPFVQRVFLAFESAARFFDQRKGRVVGTPVRKEFLTQCRPPGRERQRGGHHVLVFGGSQGAKALNSAAIEGLPDLLKQRPHMTVTHQTGEADHDRVSQAYRRAGVTATVLPFVYDMPAAINAADVVVARAGAMTVAELTTCGKPAILIPLPTAIYDHQMKNAKVMEAAGAAVVLPQADLTGATLARSVAQILDDPQRMKAMEDASVGLRRLDAAEAIVRECYALIGDQRHVNHSLGAAGI